MTVDCTSLENKKLRSKKLGEKNGEKAMEVKKALISRSINESHYYKWRQILFIVKWSATFIFPPSCIILRSR